MNLLQTRDRRHKYNHKLSIVKKRKPPYNIYKILGRLISTGYYPKRTSLL